jgi:hypothetical protein
MFAACRALGMRLIAAMLAPHLSAFFSWQSDFWPSGRGCLGDAIVSDSP